MCFPHDAHPPMPPDAGPIAAGESEILTAGDGADLLAWRAEAAAPATAGVVILPDVRGLFGFYQRLAEQFAAIGIDAVAIDYFGRTAGTGARGEDFDHIVHIRKTTHEGMCADVAAGVAHLRSRGRVQAIFTVGFCLGGSYSFLQAPNGELELTGVVGFYGGMYPRGKAGPTPIAAASAAKVPVLGLFGGADEGIPAAEVAEFADGLAAAGVDHSVHIYPGAPHSFFDRSFADYSEECADAWRRVRSFISAHTPAA